MQLQQQVVPVQQHELSQHEQPSDLSQHEQPSDLPLLHGMDTQQQAPPQQQQEPHPPGEQQQLPVLQPLPAPAWLSTRAAGSRPQGRRAPANVQRWKPQRPAPIPRATSSMQDGLKAAERVPDVQKQQQVGHVGAGQTQGAAPAPTKGLHGHASKRHQQLWDL
jgi:hypothetical protein